MEKQTTKKVLSMSFLAAALLSYLVVEVLFKSLANIFPIVANAYSSPMISHGLPIVVAVLVFSVLQFNRRIVVWAEEVIVEVSKVVFPSRKDTTAMTIVVCAFVGIACVSLLVIDFVARHLVQFIIH